MANNEAVSDEEICSALMLNGTMRAAAQAIGLPERTLYHRMDTSSFQAVYTKAKNEVLRSALHIVNSNLEAAANTVTEIMCRYKREPSNPATGCPASIGYRRQDYRTGFKTRI